MRPSFRHLLCLALACPIGALRAEAATQTAPVSASVSKPLVLEWRQDMDLGSIVLGPGSWSGATVSISRTGQFSCTNPNLTCTGAVKVATYNVAGTNKQQVNISVPNVTLVNQSDPSRTLVLVTDAPSSLLLTNSGVPGSDFSIGGSITVNSATAGGVYAGTFNVTVDY